MKSTTWIAPRWWPRNHLQQPIVGVAAEWWLFPELDQWKVFWRRENNKIFIGIGPFRWTLGWLGINRQHK